VGRYKPTARKIRGYVAACKEWLDTPIGAVFVRTREHVKDEHRILEHELVHYPFVGK
jgi:hypothetical protein